MSEPILVTVKRWKCPHCGRNHSSRVRASTHMGRCWFNPEAKGCKTCKHFVEADPGEPEVGISYTPEECGLGQSLAGHRACEACGGYGWAPTNVGGEKRCGPEVCASHAGDGSAVKPGPIVHCPLWELSSDFAEPSRAVDAQ